VGRKVNIADSPKESQGGSMRYRYWVAFGASILLALVFITAAVGKLMGHSAFLLSVSTYIVSEGIAAWLASWLPWVELVLGICLLVGVIPQIAAGISVLLVAAFVMHNGWMIANGLGYQPCGCLGVLDQVFGGKLSTMGSLYVDIGLIILALAVYFGYPGRLLNLRPWFLGWRETEARVKKED
jgi:uncharacterized membrane protein YphA (DoxX/SURF4 family)